MWMYHSHTDEVPDVYSGLLGAIIVTRRGHGPGRRHARPTSTVSSIVNFEVDDENQSHWLDHNIATFASQPEHRRSGR